MWKRLVLALVCVLVLALLTACGESEKQKYESAQSLMAQGKYAQAAEKFASLGSYEEASRLAIYCRAAAAGESGDYDTCFDGFRALGDYKDSVMMTAYYEARAYQDGSWYDKLLAADMYEHNALFLDSKERAEACRKTVWDEAMDLRRRGAIPSAIERLEALGSYKGAAGEIPGLWYEQGESLRKQKDWDGAVAAFLKADTYRDAPEQVKATRYAEGEEAAAAQSWEQAEWAYGEIMDYKDAAEKCRQARYHRAEAEEAAGNRWQATLLFAGLGDWSDAKERAWKPWYDEGVALREAGDFDGALKALRRADNSGNLMIPFPSSRTAEDREMATAAASLENPGCGWPAAAEEIRATRYAQAEALEKAGDRAGAEKIFLSLGDYADAKARAYKPHYDEGVALRAAGDWDGAVAAFEQAKDYPGAAEEIPETRYQQAQALQQEGRTLEACALYYRLSGYRDADSLLAATGVHSEFASAPGKKGDVTVTLILDERELIRGILVDASCDASYRGLNCGEEAFTSQFIGRRGPFSMITVKAAKGAKDTSRAVVNAVNSVYERLYRPGPVVKSYSVKEKGKSAEITVDLGLDENGRVAQIRVDASGESLGRKCGEEAFTGRFVGKIGPFIPGVDVDVVSNATITSHAVVRAVNSVYGQPDAPGPAGNLRTGSARGNGGNVAVELVLDAEGRVAEIWADVSQETPGLGQRCGERAFLDQFVGKSGPFILGENIDAVSGATVTSKAVVEAVNRLLAGAE